ncbi:choline phosphate cytidylyltransferase [Emydomyces testavorans]|uniref:ethanolamine-phosphate cytidylyltransferase n=1 Tax=Emydomyces testavorans TaxID=2070801 RepID=A0AAF0IF19_9EURO|nr:choline phosphate cytidylyltransferase [Emydomyces testavorans]
MASESPADGSVPRSGEWPVDPQEDVPIRKERIWIDGCFDFSHHGHAGAMLQARRLGQELFVGVHSDEEILENKGPTVMTLAERVAAVDACRWASKSIPSAPYVTSLPWISHYGCYYVVHGDDITSDSDGNDCYRFVKAARRFLVVKRTPGISTTDLVGRMLLCTRGHFIKSLPAFLAGEEGSGPPEELKEIAKQSLQRITDYATDETGHNPGPDVWTWTNSQHSTDDHITQPTGSFGHLVHGKPPRPGQRVVYVDGGFDLFSSGHIEFLRCVHEKEEEEGSRRGWYSPDQVTARIEQCGEDYGPAYVVAGVHDDEVINRWKGLNYPIMNIFERGLCVLQCRYINAIVFGAPFTPSESFLRSLPLGMPSAVYHGPTTFIPLTYDPYVDPKKLGIFKEIGNHAFQHVNAGEIVQRILKSREAFEARQRAKLLKGIGEDDLKQKEQQALLQAAN